jgi:hypothetical protein
VIGEGDWTGIEGLSWARLHRHIRWEIFRRPSLLLSRAVCARCSLDPIFNLIGHSRGPRMKCGWGCGEQLTGRNMRAHFTISAKRPAALYRPPEGGTASQACPPARAANALRLGLRCPTHGEPDADASHSMSEPAGSLRPSDRADGRHAQSPAPICLGGPRRLILGCASARQKRASVQTSRKVESLKNSSGKRDEWQFDGARSGWHRSQAHLSVLRRGR